LKDVVGIRIHKIDRTNTDSNILPCKVLEVKKVTDSKSVYKIFSKDGILKTYYSDEDLVDLRTIFNSKLGSIEFNPGKQTVLKSTRSSSE
jgi:tRNA threonylcarbamoyladenosine modification (KEOPS) complex  Pcc1 subunit